MALMALNAQTVITLRLLGMSGAIPARRGENARMVSEKQKALIDAWGAGAKAALSGRPAHDIVAASIKPLSRKVRANRRRLLK
ncbi:antifreeze protein [Marivita sp. GX14005]|uniref:antifreeze protein n=1 Tax=Marivita sp. GX14005 TaxID=2942276 RepID=UPI00201886F4|nr:antifreeze protein [Marivita sp. GX14005]MCL3881089.1 antifreeze protein [Marivita sp. GX14005]